MAPLNLAKPDRKIRAGVILLEGVTELIDVAPIDFFNGLDREMLSMLPEGALAPELLEQAVDVEYHWVTEKGDPGKLSCGLTVQATDSFASCPPLDVVIIGANGMKEPKEVEMEHLRKCYEDCAAFITICGGSHAPLRAGLLNGKTATAPLPVLPTYREHAPDVKWVEKRWQRDGKLWTSGTLLNGMDAMRAFALDTWGKGSLAEAMADLGGFPKRDVDYRSC